jgi:hypothetical protein
MGFANIDEILDYAISREEEAAALYIDLAELADRPGSWRIARGCARPSSSSQKRRKDTSDTSRA